MSYFVYLSEEWTPLKFNLGTKEIYELLTETIIPSVPVSLSFTPAALYIRSRNSILYFACLAIWNFNFFLIRSSLQFLFLTKAAAAESYCENCNESCLNGSSGEFFRQQTLSLNTITCTVVCQYEYKPKSDSDVHSTPLVSHLKRKHPKLYYETVEEEKEKKSRRQLLLLILNRNRKKKAVRLLKNNLQQWLNFQSQVEVSKDAGFNVESIDVYSFQHTSNGSLMFIRPRR